MGAGWRTRLEHASRALWAGRGPLAHALLPLAAIYGSLVALRRSVYQHGWKAAARLPVPVIVVGNVVAGGAGKTPVVLALAEHLKARGWHPGIVARGYGRRTRGVLRVDPDSDPRDVGDEPLLLRRRADVPVAVGERRANAARDLLAAPTAVDVVLCDDGLQHLALARDLEICVFDARGIGNGWRLPAGPLRERWPRPVDWVLTRAATPRLALPPGATSHQIERELDTRAHRADGTTLELAELRGQPFTALAGIAQPSVFFGMLVALGLRAEKTLALPDHADFGALQAALDTSETLVCTEKDAVKLWRWRPDALAVPLRVVLPPEFLAALDQRLERLRDGCQGPSSTIGA